LIDTGPWRLPNGWAPRPYQDPLWDYLNGGGRYAVQIAHRRWGKDETVLNWIAVASQLRVGNYWYLLPQISQGRKVIWEAIDPKRGINRVDVVFPHWMRSRTIDNNMFIEFKNGSTFQVVGSDNYDRLVGASPVGIVFSEWALSNPQAWPFLRPIIAENKGWVVFITTPRGQNHAKTLLDTAKTEPGWFWSLSSVNDTNVFSNEVLEAELRQMVKDFGEVQGNSLFSQEYECSFTAPILGSYYADALQHAEAEGRICELQIEPGLPIHTAWDLGRSDSTAIWFIQYVRPFYHLVGYYESNGAALHHYVDKLHEFRIHNRWRYGRHWFPHDVANHELISEFSRKESLESMGIAVERVPAHNPLDGINAVRRMLDRTRIDPVRCERGLECLRNYRRQWNEKTRSWSEGEYKDWTNHGCDALRTFAAGYDEPRSPGPKKDTLGRYYESGIVGPTQWSA
jgi:hypothetical protein